MELSLWGRIGNGQHARVSRMLRAMTVMQGSPLHEYVLVFAPGQANLYIQLASEEGEWAGRKEGLEWLRARKWKMRVEDIPEAGANRAVTSRLSLTSAMDGDAFTFMEKLGYSFAYEYHVQGSRFVYRDIVISLFRVEKPVGRHALEMEPVGEWMVKAAVHIANSSDVDSTTRGTEQLKALKNELRGVVDLVVADRNSLDTRYRPSA